MPVGNTTRCATSCYPSNGAVETTEQAARGGLWTSIGELLPGGMSDPVGAVRSGLPFSVFERVRGVVGASDGLLARVLATSERTLHRRRAQGRLTSEESDRLLLLAETVALAVQALDDLDRARLWLASPHALLGGEAPLEHMDTVAGIEEVKTMLHHVDHSMPV